MRVFDKPAIGIEQQLELLKQRGLQIRCKKRASYLLRAISYFRLTPYMRPFQKSGDSSHSFRSDATLKALSELYEFDRRLRLLVIDAIERIEVAVRATISNHMGPVYGSHWYLERALFKNNYDHSKLLNLITKKQEKELKDYQREVERIKNGSLRVQRTRENYARHYALKYSKPKLMPGWAMLEELTFGNLSRLFNGLAKAEDQKSISSEFSLHAPLLDSWLHTLTIVRNICAHHGRLWNRELGVQPKRPKNHNLKWPSYLKRPTKYTRVIVVFAIVHYMMGQISPQSNWGVSLKSLLDEYPLIPKQPMGFKERWDEDPFW